jgi:transcription initiation factor TFIIF subunit beta
MERSELTDRMFALFNEKPYWAITALRETLKQPDAWLREVLRDIADPVLEGSYKNMWKLKDSWEAVGAKGGEDEGIEAGDDKDIFGDDDDFEDDDMEEIGV